MSRCGRPAKTVGFRTQGKRKPPEQPERGDASAPSPEENSHDPQTVDVTLLPKGTPRPPLRTGPPPVAPSDRPTPPKPLIVDGPGSGP
jgi:hypothetical protein